MIAACSRELRVLAIDPVTSGFGFAVMEGERNLIDWGVKEAVGHNKNQACLRLVCSLFDRYQPEMLVVEHTSLGKTRRCERVRDLIRNILSLAVERRIRTRAFSRPQIRDAFQTRDARTKHEIATVIAKLLPELGPRLPRLRQPWMSEDSRMAIFDAVALALTYYATRRSRETRDLLLGLGINSTNHGK